MNIKLIGIIFLSILSYNTASAQWQIGAKTGADVTTITRSQAGRVDEEYSSQSGYDFGISGRYQFNDWFAVRADLELLQRNHRMDRNLNYLEPVYTKHTNTYLQLPVMADFSFGGKKLRGHLYAGGYVGSWLTVKTSGVSYWMTDFNINFTDFDESYNFTDEDRRFNAGLTGGVGISYDINKKWRIEADAIYDYDLVSHHKSTIVKDPRYLNTLAFTLGCYYSF